jgi:predicted lysophospholipase L1 biosynthesis ABC-type transport system permease subunit
MTVRRRRRDLALLRTLGFTAGQLRVAVVVQVAVLVMAGAAAGVLAGVVAGRQVWRLVVDQVSLPYAPAVPWIAMVAVPLCGLVLAEVLASLPRRTAARLKAGEVLRAE